MKTVTAIVMLLAMTAHVNLYHRDGQTTRRVPWPRSRCSAFKRNPSHPVRLELRQRIASYFTEGWGKVSAAIRGTN
jgi:hypothetical protein